MLKSQLKFKTSICEAISKTFIEKCMILLFQYKTYDIINHKFFHHKMCIKKT